MSADRFDRIDQDLGALRERLNGVDSHLVTVDTRFVAIDARFDGIDARLDGIDARLDGIDVRLDGIDTRLDGIDTRLERVDTRLERVETGQNDMRVEMQAGFAELRNHMGVLHEAVIARFKAMPEQDVPTRGEMNHALAVLREETGRRLDPLEAVVREHSNEIKGLKRRRG
jgi:chromosome segregation ATPase